MAPIHTIPPEILLEIFFQGITGQEYVVANPTAAPLVLTHVCKYWRHLATVAHELWCSFAIDTEHMSDAIVQMMSMWIGRSGNLPLTIALSVSPDEDANLDEDACRSAFGFLARHVGRWKDIHFTWTGHDFCALSDPLGQGPIRTPLLESFGLDTTMFSNGVGGPHVETYIRRILQDAPHIHTFIWFDTDIERRTVVDWQHIMLPGARLHTLKLECDLSPDEIVGVLAQCPVLEFADLCVAIPFNILCGIPRAITHATLRQLNIQFYDQIMRLFNLLTLPALRDLRIEDFSADTTEWHHPPFLHFLQRSKCALLSLALDLWVNFTQDTLLHTLAGLPLLEYFYIRDQKRTAPGCVGNQLLRQLCWNPTNGIGFSLCPNLRGFAFIGAIGGPITPGLLPLVILTRRKAYPGGVVERYAANTPDMWMVLESAHLSARDVATLRSWHGGWLRVDFDSESGDDVEMDWD